MTSCEPPDTITTPRHLNIAILGGGFAGVYTARQAMKRLKNTGLKDVEIGIIAAENHMVFQPMLPEVVGGSLSPRHVVNPIRTLCRGAQVLKGKVCSIDLDKKRLILDGGAFTPNVCITFDHLVFTLGADVDLSRIPGMSEHAYLLRNAGDAMKLRSAIISRMEEANLLTDAAQRRALLSFVVVGGGYSGVETAGQMQDLLHDACKYYSNIHSEEMSVSIIHSGERLLPVLAESLGHYTQRQLGKMGVNVVLNQRVKAVTARHILLNDGSRLSTSLTVCTVGNAPHPLLLQLGQAGQLPVERGHILVDATGRVKGKDTLWAAGDCTAFPLTTGGHCPQTAQFACRQGELIGDNIINTLLHHPLENFTFTGLGELAAIGHRNAVAQIMGMNFSGLLAWFMWRTIYLGKLPGLDRKLRVVIEWTLELFFPRDINLLTPQYTRTLEEIHLEPGDPLFESGDPAFSLYAVKSGEIEIIDDEQGEIVKHCHPGDHFGERALLGDRIWRFNARAKTASTLAAIDAKTFDKMCNAFGDLEKLFRKTAAEYPLQCEVDETVASMPERIQRGTAAQVMTREVVALSGRMQLNEVLEEFQRQPHSTYPVLDEQGHVLGLLRRASVYEWLKQHGLDTTHTVKEMPLAPALKVQLDTPVPQLVEDLMRNGASKAVVVDTQDRLQGMVTLYDLMRQGVASK
jgi:NADH:ubiquinone reductase (H+-translocating)